MANWVDVATFLKDNGINPFIAQREWPKSWQVGPEQVMRRLEEAENDVLFDLVRRGTGYPPHIIDVSDGKLLKVSAGLSERVANDEVVERLYLALKLVLGTAEAKKILETAKEAKK